MTKVKVITKHQYGDWTGFESELQAAYAEGYRVTHMQSSDARCVTILEKEDE